MLQSPFFNTWMCTVLLAKFFRQLLWYTSLKKPSNWSLKKNFFFPRAVQPATRGYQKYVLSFLSIVMDNFWIEVTRLPSHIETILSAVMLEFDHINNYPKSKPILYLFYGLLYTILIENSKNTFQCVHSHGSFYGQN